MLLEKCLCGCEGGALTTHLEIPIIKCPKCGVQRQSVNMNQEDYLNWYSSAEYHNGADTCNHTYKEDLAVARKRLRAYNIKSGSVVLDVGCGNGAFVYEAHKKGIFAYGTELTRLSYHQGMMYYGEFHNHNFPTDHFKFITLHDVLEHALNPYELLQECFRTTQQKGTVIVDIPDFWDDNGKHHWRPVEHLWFFTVDQITDILEEIGFVVKKVKRPIPGKVVLYCKKPVQKRTTILVPPGIGDIYWVLVKLQAFIEKTGIGIPDIYVASFSNGIRDRSLEYVKKCPFVNAKGYIGMDPHSEKVWKEAYSCNGESIFENFLGCDYFICFNGPMRFNETLETIHPELKCNWNLPSFCALEELMAGHELKEKIGNYFVAYFSDDGMFSHWLREYPVENVVNALRQIAESSGRKIVIVGGHWNVSLFHAKFMKGNEDIFVDTVGETSIDEVFGIIRYSDGFIGYPSGITFMASYFRVPTLCLWNNYFTYRFWYCSVEPEAKENWYTTVNTKTTTEVELIDKFKQITNIPMECSQDHQQIPISNRQKRKEGPKSSPRAQPKPVKPYWSVSAPSHITVVCVLRSGGDFTADYVVRLKNMVERHLPMPHDFVCMTDMEDVPCETIKLKHNWPGWWSKLELFRPGLFPGKVIYLDLDTVIVDDIERIATYPHEFSMLAAFRIPKRRASGVMAWRGDYSKLYDALVANPSVMYENGRPGSRLKPDQAFIVHQYKTIYQKVPKAMQEILGIASYKNNCVNTGKYPPGTSIVCFHGQPRPSMVKDQWVVQAWQ